MSDTVKKALEASRKASKRPKLIQDEFPTSYMPRVGRQVMAEGGSPTHDPMGMPLYSGQDEPQGGPGLYEKAMDVASRYGQRAFEPLKNVAETYLKHTGEAARQGSELMTEANRSARMQEGRLPINATWQYPLGALGLAFSPLTGAAQTAGEYATKATGDPTFGAKVALAGEFVDPTHVGMLKKMAPMMATAIPAAGKVVSAASDVQKVVPEGSVTSAMTPPAHQTTPLGLYSHAAEVASGLKQPGKPQDVYNWLSKQPGVRKEELVAAGIVDDAGNLRPEFASMPRVTAQELSERIRKGAPDVEETVMPFRGTELKPGYRVLTREELIEERGEATGREKDEFYLLNPKGQIISTGFSREGAMRPALIESKYGPDVYPELTTSGGSNYREVVLRTPSIDRPMFYVANHPLLKDHQFKTLEDMRSYVGDMVRRHDEHKAANPELYSGASSHPLLEWVDQLRNNKYYVTQTPDESVRDPNLRGFSHYNEETNPLLHIRMQDVPSPQRGLTLRVEEIQSDWAQQARKRGLFTPEQREAYIDWLKEGDKISDQYSKAYHQVRLIQNDMYDKLKGTEFDGYAELYDFFDMNKALRDRVVVEMPEFGEMLEKRAKALEKVREITAVRDKHSSTRPEEYREGMLPKAPYIGDTKQWTELGVKRALLEAGRNTEYDSVQFIKGDINRNRYAGYDTDDDYGYHYDVNVPSALKNILKKIDPEAKITTAKGPIDLKNIQYLEDSINGLTAHRELARAERDFTTVDELQDEIIILKRQLEMAGKPMEFWEVKITPKMREALQQGLPRFAAGGKVDEQPVMDMMGGVAAPAAVYEPPQGTPGLYDKAMNAVSRAGSAIGEPVVEVAKRYLENTGKAAREGSELMTEANRSARMQEGRLPINAVWQYPLGALQTAFSPLSGAAQTAGEYATKATGDPTFGAKVALAGELVDPTHVGLAAKTAPAVFGIFGKTPKGKKAAETAETAKAAPEAGPTDMSRRSFLKGTAAVAGAAALPKVPTIPETGNVAKAAIDEVSALKNILNRPVPLSSVGLPENTTNELRSVMESYREAYPSGELRTWELVSPPHSVVVHGPEKEIESIAQKYYVDTKAEYENVIGRKITDKEFKDLTEKHSQQRMYVNDMLIDAPNKMFEGGGWDDMVDNFDGVISAAASKNKDKAGRNFVEKAIDSLDDAEFLKAMYGIDDIDEVKALLDRKIVSHDGIESDFRDFVDMMREDMRIALPDIDPEIIKEWRSMYNSVAKAGVVPPPNLTYDLSDYGNAITSPEFYGPRLNVSKESLDRYLPNMTPEQRDIAFDKFLARSSQDAIEGAFGLIRKYSGRSEAELNDLLTKYRLRDLKEKVNQMVIARRHGYWYADDPVHIEKIQKAAERSLEFVNSMDSAAAQKVLAKTIRTVHSMADDYEQVSDFLGMAKKVLAKKKEGAKAAAPSKTVKEEPPKGIEDQKSSIVDLEVPTPETVEVPKKSIGGALTGWMKFKTPD